MVTRPLSVSRTRRTLLSDSIALNVPGRLKTVEAPCYAGRGGIGFANEVRWTTNSAVVNVVRRKDRGIRGSATIEDITRYLVGFSSY